MVFGSNEVEHDSRLLAALNRLEAARVTMNIKNCKFSKTSVTFLGIKIDQDGIQEDPEKTQAT